MSGGLGVHLYLSLKVQRCSSFIYAGLILKPVQNMKMVSYNYVLMFLPPSKCVNIPVKQMLCLSSYISHTAAKQFLLYSKREWYQDTMNGSETGLMKSSKEFCCFKSLTHGELH